MKTALKYRIFVLALAVFPALFSGIRAQEPQFKTIALPSGYEDCRIHAMTKDNRGLIWLGTDCGLLYFDGFDFNRAWDATDPVTALFVNAYGGMVAASESGMIVRITDLVSLPKIIKNASIDEKISAVLETPDGNIWFADYGNGLGRISHDSITRFSSENSGLSDDYIYDLALSGQTIWAASDAGIHRIRIEAGRPDFSLLTMNDGLPDVMIQTLEQAEDGNIWAGGYDGGFCSINPETREVGFTTACQQWEYGPVTGIVPAEGAVWLATGNSGLLKYELATQLVYRYSDFGVRQISRFSGIMQGMEGDLMAWSGNTIVHVPSLKFEFVFGNEKNALKDVHALMTDNEGFIWYAAESGLFRHAPDFSEGAVSQKIPLPSEISYRDITCLHQDSRGYVWVGTFGEGLYSLGPEYRSGRSFSTRTGFINDNILSITSNKNETWFATLGGASRAVYPSGRNGGIVFEDFDESGGLGNNFIYCVYSDSRERIWFATDGTGITVLENGRFKNYGLDAGLTSEKVYTITEDDKGTIWCATHDNTILYFENGRFVPVDAGLNRSYTISSIRADHLGNLLIVHENGLSVFNVEDGYGRSYGENYGIHPIDPEFNSTTRSAESTIWIGTDVGLIKYLPGHMAKNASPLPLLTSVQVMFEPVDFRGINMFSHDRNYFTFNYTGLWYQQPEAVGYRVKLTGIDLDWITTGDRQITYSRLAPGDYTFTVEASASGSFKNARQASWSFTILKPFWATVWFYLLVAALLALATYTFIRVRIRRLRRINALQQEKIRYQFETLRSQVNPHFLFNSFSTLMNAIEDDKDQALEYVEKLSVFFRNILEMRDKNLITIDEELSIAENYIYLQKSRYGKNLVVDTAIGPEERQTLMPPLTLQLLIENAIKHNIISKSKPLRISIFTENEYLAVSNTLQKKNFTGNSTGFGLKTIQHRYRMISNHEVEISEESGKFVVMLPLIKNV